MLQYRLDHSVVKFPPSCITALAIAEVPRCRTRKYLRNTALLHNPTITELSRYRNTVKLP